MNKEILGGVLLTALSTLSGVASATVLPPSTVIDFQALASASVAGKPNVLGSSTAGMYKEDGFVVGIAKDDLDTISHLHKEVLILPDGTSNTVLQYHSDSSGVYLRSQTNEAFSLWSMDFIAGYDAAENPHTVGGGGDGVLANDYWDIYGFSDARNPDLLLDQPTDPWSAPTDPNTGNPAHPAVAHAMVTNGFSGTLDLLALDPNFANISSFWIHYHGYPHSPNAYIDPDNPIAAYQFALEIDNITLNAAGVVPPAAVPVPAAVWMFGSGFLGLLSFGRRKVA